MVNPSQHLHVYNGMELSLHILCINITGMHVHTYN